MQFGITSGVLISLMRIAKKYNLQPTQIAKAVSKNIKSKHNKHSIHTG